MNEELLKCPHCPRTFKAKTGLGSHMRVHGVKGSSPTTLNYRKQKQRDTKPSTPRSELVKVTKNARANGYSPDHQREAFDDQRHRIEAATTLAIGRCQELLASLSFQFDVPPRSLSAHFVRTLGKAEKVW